MQNAAYVAYGDRKHHTPMTKYKGFQENLPYALACYAPMVQHGRFWEFEKRVRQIVLFGSNRWPESGSAVQNAASGVHRMARRAADKTIQLKNTKMPPMEVLVRIGSEIAQELPLGRNVFVANIDDPHATPFFYTEKSLKKLDNILNKGDRLLEEVEELLKIEEVMNS
jgi:hypothetical protein